MAGSRKKRNQELLPQHDPRAPLDSPGFLSAAQPVLSLLTADLLERADASTAVTAELRRTHAAEHAAGRTAEPYEVWRRQRMVQVAAAWLLSCVFVRVLEDRGLLARHRLAGPGAEDSQRQFGELAPYLGPRDYLLTLFRELAKLPATAPLFDARHNLVWRLAPSQGGAQALLDLLRAPQPDAPAFRFGQPDTRFLGDLYQDISADVRETYALLQTPDFVESFILDRTLDPALAEYGPDDTTLIDPTCGSGHFLLGAFARLLDAQRHQNPGHSAEAHANNALARVFGVDINPYAVAIARFRLTLAFWDAIGLRRLVSVQSARPPLNVAVGDSLFHASGEQIDFVDMPGQASTVWYGPTFAFDDEDAVKAILGQRFAAVVGNPPYIGVKDAAVREAYRKRYVSCYREYILSEPFLERFFQLARIGGYTGQITSNAFTKREHGKKVIEEVLPKLELTLVINAAGVPIPGHGTPTVLLFGRNRRPEGESAETVLAVLAKRGTVGTPEDPGKGEVWTSITRHWHEVGFDGDYISVERVKRATLNKHPWSLEGGGAGQLKEVLEARAARLLGELVEVIGFGAVTREDDVFEFPPGCAARYGLTPETVRQFVVGENVRDWTIQTDWEVLFPYSRAGTLSSNHLGRYYQLLWNYRTQLWLRRGKGFRTKQDSGGQFYEYSMFYPERIFAPLRIAFAEVATHNHFSLDRGGKVFKQTAPIITLSKGATEADHIALLAYLNSSVACFWMKQVAYPKGMHNGSEANATPFLVRFAFDSTKLHRLPLPATSADATAQLYAFANQIDQILKDRQSLGLSSALHDSRESGCGLSSAISSILSKRSDLLHRAIALQEEIDWLVYYLFGLVGEYTSVPTGELRLAPGERPFEILLARSHPEAVATGWFRWSEIVPLQGWGDHIDPQYRAILERRLTLADTSASLTLLENPVCKRRWRQPAGKAAQELETDDKIIRDQAALFLAENIETAVRSQSHATCARDVCATATSVADFDAVLSWRFSEASASLHVAGVLSEESVPFLAAYRYTEPGLEKYTLWEATWSLQRREDAGERVGPIQAPPRYEIRDFRDARFFRVRDELDVPKERFISYPGCESDADGEPVYGWAGWDHLQRASALMDLFYKRKNDEGWAAERLMPILAGLLELLPWLKQWHNDPDADGSRMADDYEAVLDEELRGLGLTRDKLRAWRPAPGRGRGGAARVAAAKANTAVDTDDAPVAEAPAKRRGRSAPPAANDPPTAEALPKHRGRPPRAAAEAPAPVASTMAAPAAPAAPPASAELALFPGESPAQPRKRGRPKKT